MKSKKLRTPLLFKEGLGWLITGCCAVFLCAVSFYATTDSTGITYTATTANTSTSTNSIDGVSCSGGFTTTKGKDNQPLSITDNTDTCKRWHGWLGIRPTSAEEYKMQYDTLRRYIESCGKNDDSYQVFGSLDAAVQGYSPNDTTPFETYRNWLFSVLYLNTTQPFYFCACMQ